MSALTKQSNITCFKNYCGTLLENHWVRQVGDTGIRQKGKTKKKRGRSHLCSLPARLPVGSSHTPELMATAPAQRPSFLPNSDKGPSHSVFADLQRVASHHCQVFGGQRLVCSPIL